MIYVLPWAQSLAGTSKLQTASCRQSIHTWGESWVQSISAYKHPNWEEPPVEQMETANGGCQKIPEPHTWDVRVHRDIWNEWLAGAQGKHRRIPQPASPLNLTWCIHFSKLPWFYHYTEYVTHGFTCHYKYLQHTDFKTLAFPATAVYQLTPTIFLNGHLIQHRRGHSKLSRICPSFLIYLWKYWCMHLCINPNIH